MICEQIFNRLSSVIYQFCLSSYQRNHRYSQNLTQPWTLFPLTASVFIYIFLPQLLLHDCFFIGIMLTIPIGIIFTGMKAVSQLLDSLIMFLSIFSPIIISQFQTNITASFIVTSLGPLFTLLITSNSNCFYISIVLYLIRFNTRMKAQFILRYSTCMENGESHELLDQSFLIISIQTVLMMLLLGLMDYIMQKCILELTQKRASFKENQVDSFKLFENVCTSFVHHIGQLCALVDFFLSKGITSQVNECIRQVNTCVKLFRNEVDNFLSSDNLKRNELEILPIHTRTPDFLSTIWSIASDLLKEKGTFGLLKVQRKVPSLLLIDSGKLKQIILNLLQFGIATAHKGIINMTVEWLDCDIINDECFEPIPYNYEEEGVFEKNEAMHLLDIDNKGKALEKFQVFKSSEKEIKFQAKTYSRKIAFGTLKITVWNAGPGLTDKEIEGLFKEHQDRTTDNESISDEIRRNGLRISRNLVRKMEGDIRVYSKKDVGTTLVGSIPVPIFCSCRENTGLRAKIARLRSKKLHVMVGANDPTFAHQVAVYLDSLEVFTIEQATTVTEFFVNFSELALGMRSSVDMILVDTSLAHLDLVGFCERIRNEERKNKMGPLYVLLTGSIQKDQKIKNLLDRDHPGHVNNYLKRPFDFEELLDAIKDIC